jgi:MoaA/NifB/PqqE/SkfB family radical SAM enzyme
MCFGVYSSRIARDPSHSKWAGTPDSPHGVQISGQRDFVRKELLQHARHIKRLHFVGGETLLSRDFGDTLQCLVDAGVADGIIVSLVTNGTVVKSPWLKLLERFKHTGVCVSIDGFDQYYDYIRYPNKWEKLTSNIQQLKELPNTTLVANATLQAYNALNIADLFRYLDSIGLGFYAYPIAVPHHLGIGVLPPRARRLAAQRLRQYGERDCRHENREMVRGLAGQLEPVNDSFDVGLVHDFMLFTNDLDRSRAQSFEDTHKELAGLIADAGFVWTNETLHARPLPLRGVSLTG